MLFVLSCSSHLDVAVICAGLFTLCNDRQASDYMSDDQSMGRLAT